MNFTFFNIILDNFIFPLEWNQSPSSHIRVLVRNSFRLHDISITISCYPAQLYKFIFYTLLGYAPKNFPFKRLWQDKINHRIIFFKLIPKELRITRPHITVSYLLKTTVSVFSNKNLNPFEYLFNFEIPYTCLLYTSRCV